MRRRAAAKDTIIGQSPRRTVQFGFAESWVHSLGYNRARELAERGRRPAFPEPSVSKGRLTCATPAKSRRGNEAPVLRSGGAGCDVAAPTTAPREQRSAQSGAQFAMQQTRSSKIDSYLRSLKPMPADGCLILTHGAANDAGAVRAFSLNKVARLSISLKVPSIESSVRCCNTAANAPTSEWAPRKPSRLKS